MQILFFFLQFVYLKVRPTGKRREGGRNREKKKKSSFSHWLSSQMAATASAMPGQGQTSSRSPMLVKGAQAGGVSSATFLRASARSRIRIGAGFIFRIFPYSTSDFSLNLWKCVGAAGKWTSSISASSFTMLCHNFGSTNYVFCRTLRVKRSMWTWTSTL